MACRRQFATSTTTTFGNTTSGSLAGRFDFTDRFALRGSVSTGFRAPSLGQEYFSQTSSLFFANGNSAGLPAGIYNAGLVPVGSQIAQLLGAEALKPEKSRDDTLGAVWNPTDALTLSLDVYQIHIQDRIALSGAISTTAPNVVDYLAANGIGNLNFRSIDYFTNAANTRTRGVDFVGTYLADLGHAGTLATTLSANYNQNTVTDVKPNPAILTNLGVNFVRLNRQDIKGYLANSSPRSKLILSEQYNVGNWGVTGTLTRYGRYTSYVSSLANYDAAAGVVDQTFSPKWLLDLAVNYRLQHWTFSIGADDALNTYPDRNIPNNSNNGTLPYSTFSRSATTAPTSTARSATAGNPQKRRPKPVTVDGSEHDREHCMHKSLAALIALTLLASAHAWSQDAHKPENISSQALDASAPPTTLAALARARPVTAKHAMVVSAQHLATQVGVEILKQGGNAVDAAVAVGYALAVVHPCCGNIGGGGFMVVHLAGGKNAVSGLPRKGAAESHAHHVPGRGRQRGQGPQHRHLPGRGRARHGDGPGRPR